MTDTYFIFPDSQFMAWLEGNSEGQPASPWGQLSGDSDLEQVAEWICNYRDTFNIKGALHMGDMVRNGDEASEWAPVAAAIADLDACNVPFLPTFGNHEPDDTLQQPAEPADATLYHTTVGQDVLDDKGWFANSRAERPTWIEVDESGTSLYEEDTSTYKSRSFWVPLPPFNFAVPEWEYGIRISKSSWTGGPSLAAAWLDQLRTTYPNDYWIQITHAGPCDVPGNCDLTPESIGGGLGPFGGDWGTEVESLGPQFVGFMNGHWGRNPALACWGGGAVYNALTRDDGTRALLGGFDTNCGTRQDPGANAVCSSNGRGEPTGCPGGPECIPCEGTPYTWHAWMRLKRESREICYDTIRVIDVDANDDGTPDATATVLTDTTFESDRGATYGDPDPLDANLPDPHNCIQDDFDTGVTTGCPNPSETCITIADLP
jgi:hypothetical protein